MTVHVYWKHFGEPNYQLMLCLTKCHKIYICTAKNNTDSWVLRAPNTCFGSNFRSKFPTLSVSDFFGSCNAWKSSNVYYSMMLLIVLTYHLICSVMFHAHMTPHEAPAYLVVGEMLESRVQRVWVTYTTAEHRRVTFLVVAMHESLQMSITVWCCCLYWLITSSAQWCFSLIVWVLPTCSRVTDTVLSCIN